MRTFSFLKLRKRGFSSSHLQKAHDSKRERLIRGKKTRQRDYFVVS